MVPPRWRRTQIAVTLLPFAGLALLILLYGLDLPAFMRKIADAPPVAAALAVLPVLLLLSPPDSGRMRIASRNEQLRWMLLILAGRLLLLLILFLAAAILFTLPRPTAPLPLTLLALTLSAAALWFRFWGLR